MERDGYPFVIGALVIALLCFVGDMLLTESWTFPLGVFFAVLTFFFAFFFRSPNRQPDERQSALIAPADGRVIKIERLESYPGYEGAVDKIAIFLSVFDVHVNWMPVSGQVVSSRHIAGAFHLAYVDKASTDNERTEIGIKSEFGLITLKQIAGTIARRIVCRLENGQTVKRGQKFGLIKFGSRTEVIMKTGSEILISVGDKVRGGQTALALLPTPDDNRDSSKFSDQTDLASSAARPGEGN